MMKSRFKQLKLNALIWALIIPVISFAQQSISGTITDADTGEAPTRGNSPCSRNK